MVRMGELSSDGESIHTAENTNNSYNSRVVGNMFSKFLTLKVLGRRSRIPRNHCSLFFDQIV